MSSTTAIRPATVDHLSTLLASQPLLASSPWEHVNVLREQAHEEVRQLAATLAAAESAQQQQLQLLQKSHI